jgi:multiple sugar transport system substrate-binding protein
MISRHRSAAVAGLAATLVVASLVVSSCGKKGSETSGVVTVTFWHSFVASTVPAFNDVVQRFEQEHPGIRINAQYVPTGDALVHKLVAAVQSQTAPDISWIHSDFLDKLVEAGALYRIDAFLHGPDSLSAAELADIVPALLQSATWRDTLYALPMEATSLALLYNRDLFRKAGLDPDRPPANWNELHEYARKLTVDRDGDGKTDQYGFYVPVFPASGDLSIWMVLQWTPFLWQAGGEEIDKAQTKVLFNSPAGVNALTLWRQMYDDMQFSTFTIAHDLGFASGILAMILDGPWNLPRYRLLKGVDWAVAPLPAGPAGRATYLAGEHMAIFRQSKHPREAWTFVRWMMQPDVQAMFSMRSGYLPVRRSTLELKEYNDYLATDPALSAFVRQMVDGRGRAPIDYHRTEINRFLAEAVEKATLGRVDPKTALDEAAARANALLSSRRTAP